MSHYHKAASFFTLSCGYWKIMSKPKCLFFLQANSQWFCPQKTFSLSLPFPSPKHRNTHTHECTHTLTNTYTNTNTHTPLLSLPLPYPIQNWLGEVNANHLCYQGNNQLPTSLSPNIFKVKQKAICLCSMHFLSDDSFKLTQIAFELYSLKGTQIFSALDDLITPIYRQGK